MAFSSPSPEDADLLKAVLPPLLDDFQHWFGRTIDMLEGQTISFLTKAEQAALLSQVREALQQVNASKALAAATDSQAGIEMPVVMGWHSLVHECWSIAIKLRKEGNASNHFDYPESYPK